VFIGESPILGRHIDAQLCVVVAGLFMSIFFCVAGLRADLSILRDPLTHLMTLGLVFVASIGKFGGSIRRRQIGGLTSKDACAR
jgi:Kef-type K+ transport system membrane component KefB